MSPAVKKMVQKHCFEGTERVEYAIQAAQASGDYATTSEFIREAIEAYAVALGYLESKPAIDMGNIGQEKNERATV